MPEESSNGLCDAGRATLRAHKDLIDRHEDGIKRLDAKIDKLVWLLMTTLLTALVNLLLYLLKA